MENFPSIVRQAPVASKFSKLNPRGSILEWHDAQIALFLCCSICCRSEAVVPTESPSKLGTFGGGGGTFWFKIFSNIHLPRSTTEVRLG